MPFGLLVLHNLMTKKLRTVITGLAVALGIAMIVTLGVLTFSLKESAVAILETADADFTVAQEGVAGLLSSSLDAGDVEAIAADDAVKRAIGVLVVASELDEEHPLFLEIGIDSRDLAAYGVRVVAGRSYDDTAGDEVILGYRAARDLGIGVGDTFTIDDRRYRVVGLYSSDVTIADSSAMFPLPALQDAERLPGVLTLAFVQVRDGASVDAARRRIEAQLPQLATVRSEAEFGRIDRNVVLLTAANAGGIVLALAIGAGGVLVTSLLSFHERIREFGTLRAIGWSRIRLFTLVLGEAVMIGLFGAVVGVAIGFGVTELLTRVDQLRGVFDPRYTSAILGRALGFGVVVALVGANYPALRAATLSPLKALRRE
jgi:putative ABC transport system permease protein